MQQIIKYTRLAMHHISTMQGTISLWRNIFVQATDVCKKETVISPVFEQMEQWNSILAGRKER